MKKNISEERKQALREHIKRISESPQAKKAKQRNVRTMQNIVIARAILKNCPLDCQEGQIFQFTTRVKSFIVVDIRPKKHQEDGKVFWLQRFIQITKLHIGAESQEIRTPIAIRWDYELTNENIMDHPILVNI